MATYQVVAWKGIPASVEARDDDGAVTVPLSDRFQMLIDSVAMQLGLTDSDAYIDLWAREAPQERPGPARAVAEAVAAELEERFPTFIGRAFARPA
ncbi:MAG: virulence factor [Candidatus Rokubacteria bacterium]|nr:virulence factor [Candidatus Rokubacteria bacterium]